MRLFRRMRHCLVCNIEYPRAVGTGLSRCYCSYLCEGLAWSDWSKGIRTCRFRSCSCPADRWHTRVACGPRTRGLLYGRCLACGHFAAAHGRRPGSSFTYGEVSA